MFAWFIILVIQTRYIRNRNHKDYIRLGIAGMVIALGVIISTVYVFAMVYQSWEAMPFYVKANRFFMLSFAILVLLGYLNRKNGARHKRLIYMASLLILEPILSRVAGNLHIENVEFLLL
jgi:hypothetical protein